MAACRIRILCALISVAAAVDDKAVPYSLVAAGSSCSNVEKEVSANPGSVQACADLVCADPLCGTVFIDRSHKEGACFCLASGQACADEADVDANTFEISDTTGCEPQETHDCFVMAYESGDFTGWSASFPEGHFSENDFLAYGVAGTGFGALYVSGENCYATVHGESDFTGWSATFGEGSYSAEDLKREGAQPQNIRSLTVHYSSTHAAPEIAAEAPQDVDYAAHIQSKSFEKVHSRKVPLAPPRTKPAPMPVQLDNNKPSWLFSLPQTRWQNIPSWARKRLTEDGCNAVTLKNCDEDMKRYIDYVKLQLCSKGDCLHDHYEKVEEEALKMGSKRGGIRGEGKVLIEMRSAVLWSILAQLPLPEWRTRGKTEL